MEINVQEKLTKLSQKAHNILLEAQKLADQNDIAFRFTFPWADDKTPNYYRQKALSKYEVIQKTVDILYNLEGFYIENKTKEEEKIKNDVISYLLGILEQKEGDLSDEEYFNLF